MSKLSQENKEMAEPTQETFYLTDEKLAAFCKTIPFSNLPKPDQEILEELLQTAFCGSNRLDNKLLRLRLTMIRDNLGLNDEPELWLQLKREIENALSGGDR
jgi:hypothetical protein